MDDHGEEKTVVGVENRSEVLVAALELRYAEPWRHYHTWEHVQEMLSTLAAHPDEVADRDIVTWAIRYHDAVYDPQATHGRNEELSARLAETELSDVIGRTAAQKVATYILATADHRDGATDPDLAFFLELDLVILGSAPERYERYSADVRSEYAHVPADLYSAGRSHVLRELAARGGDRGIFQNPALRARFEDQAHLNVTTEIATLGG